MQPGACGKRPSSASSGPILCTIDMQPGNTYLLNVRLGGHQQRGQQRAGRNSYAIEAVSSGASAADYAYNKMVMYNNVSSGAATFSYVAAEVSPEIRR